MTTTYLHLTDTGKPKSQTAITASFVDENGKHVNIGGGGTAEIHTDSTLTGNGTTGNPLKLSDTINQKITKAGTITEDNLTRHEPASIPADTFSKAQVMQDNNQHLYVLGDVNGGVYTLNKLGWTALSVPAITALKAINTLTATATLNDVIGKVNEILNAVKNAHAAQSDAITDPSLNEPTIGDTD